MSDLRSGTALRQLADLGDEPDPRRWAWTVARLDPAGRVLLPPEARVALGTGSSVRGACNRVALVLRRQGAGATVAVDARGRLCVPVWLRRSTGGSMAIGTRRADGLVVVAPTTVLDGLGELLAGGRR